MLGVEVAALQDKVVSLEEECQDRCRMANEWYEALKVSYNVLVHYPSPFWSILAFSTCNMGFPLEFCPMGFIPYPPPPQAKPDTLNTVLYIYIRRLTFLAYTCISDSIFSPS